MGRWIDALGVFGSSFGIGPKGTRASLDASGLTGNRTHTLPDKAGTVALQGVFGASGAGGSVSNTTALTNVASITVPGGALGDGTKGAVRIRITGRFRNNNAGATASTLRLQFTYGGQTLWDDVSAAQTASAGIHAFDLDLLLQGAGATNSQNFGGKLVMSQSSAPTTGNGSIANVPTPANGFNTAINNGNSPSTVDSTANQTFALNVQHGVASVSTIFQVDTITPQIIS